MASASALRRRARQRRQRLAHRLDPLGRWGQRHKVRFEEIAVIVGIFLDPQGVRAAIVLVPVARFLTHGLAALDQRDLATCLVFNGPPKRADAVDVLDLAAGSQGCARLADADIGVAAHAAFLHLGVAGPDGDEDAAQLADVLAGLLRCADVRPRDDLHERHACPVEVDQRMGAAVDPSTATAEVGALAGVLFEVGALHPDACAVGQGEEPVDVQRLVVLADLVGLGHVRVEVVLAMEGARPHGAVQRQADAHRQFDGLAVEHRQRSGQAEGDGVDVGVRLVAEAVRARAEQLGGRGQFDVHLEADDQLPAVDQICCGRRGYGAHAATADPWPLIARSRAIEAANICSSPSVPASTWMPTGRSSVPVPKGTLIPGWPERLVGMV